MAVAVAVLLLPLLIRLLGRRAYATRRTGQRDWRRWSAAVTRRPVISAAVATAVLLLLAAPALSMKIRAGLLPQLPAGSEARAGVVAATRGGRSDGGDAHLRPAPLRLGHGGRPGEPGRGERGPRARARGAAGGAPGAHAAVADGREAVVQFGLRVQAETAAAKELVGRLRDDLRSSPVAARADTAVGGIAARWRDVEHETIASMWKVFLFVLGLAFVVLLFLLRAPVVSLKAVLMILLSVAAAYGVLVAVFQWGWLAGPLGLDALGYIDPAVPPLVFAIVFGLSMDYQVFLLTRIRERWDEHGDTPQAVAEALVGQRAHDHGRGSHGRHRLRHLRVHGRVHRAADRTRLRGGDPHRRDTGPAGPGAVDHAAAGRAELVAAVQAP